MPGMYPYGVATYGAAPILAGDPFYATATRLAVEVLAANDRIDLETTRVVAEVLADDPFIPVTTTLETDRLVAEVLAAAAAAPYRATVGRIALEMLAAASPQGLGMRGEPSPAVNWTLFLAAKFASNSTSGEIAFFDGESLRLALQRSGASLTLVTLTDGIRAWRGQTSLGEDPFVVSIDPGTGPSTSVVRINGSPLTPDTATAGSWTSLSWDRFGTPKSEEEFATPQQANIGELMILDHTASAGELDYLESYLTCKWITPGCNPWTDL